MRTDDRPAPLESQIAWELRGCWAGFREVGLSLRGGRRIRGYVTHVAVTDAFALVWDGTGDIHVPLVLVLAVHRPHFHEATWGPAVPPPLRPEPIEAGSGQMSLF
jgi:hypothetical protein